MKGQAAFELITTYGWIIITTLIVASTIAFLDFTNPQVFLKEECHAGEKFACKEFGMFETPENSTLLLVLRNKIEEPLNKKSTLNCFFGEEIFKTEFDNDILPGELFEITCSGTKQNWTVGSKTRVNFKIVYYTNITGKGIPQVSSGYVYSEVK